MARSVAVGFLSIAALAVAEAFSSSAASIAARPLAWGRAARCIGSRGRAADSSIILLRSSSEVEVDVHTKLDNPMSDPQISHALLKRSFNTFINKQVGHWSSERTYHYVGGHQDGKELEQSKTVFQVAPLSQADIDNVFSLNETPREDANGFRVIFDTIMRNTGRKVHAETDVVFVPKGVSGGVLSGVYLRSQGYEDKDPAAATFTFQQGTDVGIGQLNMVTRYSQVVSVDQITLLDDDMRMRRIVNYKRPATPEEPLKELQLLGFGVEKRGETELL